jgi:enoyl-CoA hydratase/carnithine racemase
VSDEPRLARVERDGPVLIVTITRPERSNALHSPAHFELSRIFDEFEKDPAALVAVITGEGDRAFCAGNDLKVQAEGGPMERPATGFAGLTKRRHRTKPIIAAVNGVALGGGFEIVLACDLAVAAPSARFALPELRHGLVPLAGMHLLPRQVGSKIAMAILLTGKALSAADALSLGLINEIAPERGALEAAKAMGTRILRGSPEAVATCLDIVASSLRTPDLFEALENEYESLARLRASADFVEGPRAFAERRPPVWSALRGKGPQE